MCFINEVKGNLPSSDFAAMLHAVLLMPRTDLQNLRCIFSKLNLSSRDKISEMVPLIICRYKESNANIHKQVSHSNTVSSSSTIPNLNLSHPSNFPVALHFRFSNIWQPLLPNSRWPTLNIRFVGLSDCRAVGLTDCRAIGLSDYWSVGF